MCNQGWDSELEHFTGRSWCWTGTGCKGSWGLRETEEQGPQEFQGLCMVPGYSAADQGGAQRRRRSSHRGDTGASLGLWRSRSGESSGDPEKGGFHTVVRTDAD